jgi:polysaccharide chain length determinant protein (PEP-CTERM system associated)
MKSFEQDARILFNEAFAHRKFIVIVFFAVVAVALVLGAGWPKTYTSSATIIVEEKNIIQPLMQGAAVPTEVMDNAKIAREIIYSRKVLNKVLEDGGWLEADASAAEREDLIARLKRQTTVSTLGTNLIKIEYKDSDAERAFKTAKKYTEVFIAESVGTKIRESRSAFNFIDAQVKEYQAKLQSAEDKIKQFRAAGLDARPPRDPNRRGESLQMRLEQTRMELQEAETKRDSLERQLAKEMAAAVTYTREREYRDRLTAAQAQLATLRVNYQDTYPDIVRLKKEVEELQQLIATERKLHPGQTAMSEASAGVLNQQMKEEINRTNTLIDTLTARVAETERFINAENENTKRYGGTTLAELMRSYEVNQNIMDDLLKRRENARVSMNLDREKQGLSLRINDEAALPTQPSGPPFIQFALGGLVLGLLIPFVLIYGKNQLDARIRTTSVITEKLNLPLAARVPHLSTSGEAASANRSLHGIGLLILGTIFIVISLIWSGSHL